MALIKDNTEEYLQKPESIIRRSWSVNIHPGQWDRMFVHFYIEHRIARNLLSIHAAE